MTLTLVSLLVLSDIAPFEPPRPPPPQCRADADCRLSTFDGCCGSCCPREPHAVPVNSDEGRICAAVDCAMPDCARIRCAGARPVEAFEAVCRANRCVAQIKAAQPPPPGAMCRADADCSVAMMPPPPGAACHQSACGCCPTEQAVSRDTVPLTNRPAPRPQQKSPDAPPFGLSTGNGQGAPQPQCSPCPGPSGQNRAACVSSQCVLVPNAPRPIPRPRPPRPPPVG